MINQPSGYIAFPKLTICSNILVGGGVPLRIKDQFPILVGRGEYCPLVWLSATKNGKEWQIVIEKNEPKNKNFVVNYFNDGKSVQIVFDSLIIAQAIQLSENEAEVSILDLRPLGVAVRGNRNGLQVGNNMYRGNIFQGGAGMIAVEEKVKISEDVNVVIKKEEK